MTFNVQKGHFDTRNIKNLPTVGGWHPLPHPPFAQSLCSPPPPPPIGKFWLRQCLYWTLCYFLFQKFIDIALDFFFFFFFLGGGGRYITSSINVFYEQWIHCFLHTLSSGFKQGQFVCVLRAVQCVLSALSAKVEVADINVNDRCAAFLPYIKAVSSSECWKFLFLEIRFVEFRNILLFSTKWIQLISFTQYCKYIKANLCEVLNRSYERNFLHKKDNKIGKIQFFEKKL